MHHLLYETGNEQEIISKSVAKKLTKPGKSRQSAITNCLDA